MKLHRYEITVYEGALDWTHGMGQKQNRLLIPGKAVIGYRSKTQIDFFSDNERSIAEAQEVVDGRGKGKYLGEITLPNKKVLKLVSAGKTLNQARETFHKNLQSLIENFIDCKETKNK